MSKNIIKGGGERVLVTGGTGFVGRKIVDFLLAQNMQVVLVVRDLTSIPDAWSDQLSELICTADIFQETVQWWETVCCDVDIIIHAAWYAEPGEYLRSKNNIDCLKGSINLASGAVLAGVRRFIGIGTCFEYAMSEDPISVSHRKEPETLYAASKLSLYYMLNELFKFEEVEFAWCRLFYLFGEGENPKRFVPYLTNKLAAGQPAKLTSGLQVRDYMNVSEAAKIICSIAIGSATGPVNVCSGAPVTIRQFAEHIADQYGRRDLLLFGEREDNHLDPPSVVGVPNF